MKVFEDYAYYYDMFYGDKNYAKEAREVSELLGGVEGEPEMLIIGSGTGKHDFEFAKLGYNTHGIDISQQMIEQAEKAAINQGVKNVTFEVADARNYKARQKYDCAVSLFHVMSYQNKNADIIAVMKNCYEALRPGAKFVFDLWYGPGVLSDPPTYRLKQVDDNKNSFIRFAEPIIHPNENVVDVKYKVLVIDKQTSETRQIEEVHSMRYYFKPELEEYLRSVGFKLIKCVDCNTLDTPNFNSWTAYFVVQK